MATDAHSAGHHNGRALILYLVVGLALSIFTITSFWVYGAVRNEQIPANTGFFIILSVAAVKAMLVAAIFMHLMLDWSRVYFMIIPALILGTLLIIVLLPDIVLSWHS
jgi:heme/copper-type cytochrome/quinol oxidase subunit 4